MGPTIAHEKGAGTCGWRQEAGVLAAARQEQLGHALPALPLLLCVRVLTTAMCAYIGGEEWA